MTFAFLDCDVARTVANVVVDGSANEATVLTLSHWPGATAPPGLARDLSAEMAFAYLDSPCDHAPAAVVTNNHFDQDGLVSIFALTEPDLALAHRELLIDVAAAGDFGTFQDRRAARASMVIAHWCNLGWGYSEALGMLVALATEPDHYREVWEREDANLSASEAALARGSIVITEHPDIDLAIVDIADDEPLIGGHRFAHQTFEGMHPMALHNATSRFRILVVAQNRYRFVDRYETWVQFQSRATLPRRNMEKLATAFNQLDAAHWTAENPNDLAPMMTHTGESQLDRNTVVEAVTAFLQ